MTFVGPKVKDYSEKVYNAGARGFNFLVDFEREMWEAFPETTQYRFGKFSDSDVNNVTTEGWQHLKGSMFGIENINEWNTKVGLRFSLIRDADDNLTYGGEYVMLMPKQFRDEVILPARKAAHDKLEQSAKDAATYVHPDDPEKNKMRDAAAALSEATSSTTKVTVKGKGEPDLGPDPGGNVW
jgi:hypothetical protein